MANNFIDSIMERNRLRKARKIADSLINGEINVNDISSDIKEMILKEKMITDKVIIMSLLETINDEGLFHEVFSEHIKTFSDLNELSDNLKYKFLISSNLKLNSKVIATISSIQNNDQRINLYKKFINFEDKQPYISTLLNIPEDDLVEVIGSNCNHIDYFDVLEIIESLSEENTIRLLENNKEFVKSIMGYEFEPFIDDGYEKRLIKNNSGQVLDFKYIIYKKLQNVDNQRIPEELSKIIDMQSLSKEIDEKLFSEIEEIPEAFRYLVSEDDKLKYIELLPSTSIEKIAGFYRNLSKDSQDKYRKFLLESGNFENMLNEILARKHDDYELLLNDFILNDNLNEEALIKIFPAGKRKHGIDGIQKKIFERLSDNGKAIILSDKSNFFNINNMYNTLFEIDMLELLDFIEDDVLYAKTAIKALDNAKSFNRDNVTIEESYYKKIINEYFSQVSDERKFEIIKKLVELNSNKDMVVLNSLLLHIDDSKVINEVLKFDLYEYEKYGLNKKYQDIEQEKEYDVEQLMITRLISKLENTNELIQNVNLSKFHAANIMQILIKSTSEISFEAIPGHPEITPDIIKLCKEYSGKLNQLTRKGYSEEDLLQFYKKIATAMINKDPDLNKKLTYLTMLQKKNEEVGITANLGMLDDEILKIFGGIDGVERLLKYPKLQENIVRRSKEERQIISICNKYINDNLQMGDYSITEIANQYTLSVGNIDYDNVSEEDYETIYEMAMANEILRFNCFSKLRMNIKDPKQYMEMKNKVCDDIISGKVEDVDFHKKDAYLFKYYNMSYKEATEVVTKFEDYIKTLPDDEECIVYKEYINGLKAVLDASTEELVEAYNLSKDKEPVKRIEIEMMNEQLKSRFAKQMKATLFDPKSQNVESAIDYQGNEIKVYEADKDFHMLVSVLDAYGGDKVDYEDYSKQWNTNENAANQRICASYISDRNLTLVKKHNCVIMGFEGFSDYAVVEAAPYDIISKNDELVTETVRDSKFMEPEILLESARRYTEVDIERTDLDHGGKLQPSYLVSFASSIDEIEEETKKAATQFGIPIVLVNHEKIESRNSSNLQEKVAAFIDSRNPALISEIVQDYWVYKTGSKTTIKDKKDENVQADDLEEKYFSNDKFKTIMKTIQQVAKEEKSIGNIDSSKSILLALNDAINNEREIDIIWIDQFFSPRFFAAAKYDQDKFLNFFYDEMIELTNNLKEVNNTEGVKKDEIQR